MFSRISVLLLSFLLLATPLAVQAQTASTGAVTGTVMDPTGAVVPGAKVELFNKDSGQTRTQETSSSGGFVFTSLPPAIYKVTVTAQGFQSAVIPDLKVDVLKSHSLNITLQVGTIAEVIEVSAATGVDLQTLDATIGVEITGIALQRLPTTNRSAASLLLLQPLVMPAQNAALYGDVGGQVAGARSDQSTFLIDGGDATSNTEATGGYNTGFAGGPEPVVPVPVESIEEFRVGTTNPNATYGRSEGGQLALVTKRGTNDIHGSVYWYHQNDNLDANRWDFNSTGITKPEKKDNRYGFSVGGPVIKDSTWLFGNYEGRRFPRTENITRIVPSDTLRQGILRFRDGTGNIISYNLNLANGPLSAACVGGACDPLGVGMPQLMEDFFALYPPGNDPSGGDGLNTIGLRAPVDNTLDSDFFVVRFDQKITDTATFFASYRYHSVRRPGTQQIDIAGLTGPGIHPTRRNPLEPRFVVGGVNWQIKPNLTSETRVSWLRHWWEWATEPPFPQVSGLGQALDVGTEDFVGTISEPINIDTQQGRSRVWNGKDTYVAQNMTWIKGPHTIQFGGSFRRQDIFHSRVDKVFGGMSSGPIQYSDTVSGDGTALSIPTSFRPVICGGAVTTNCLQAADSGNWDTLYANVLGLIDRNVQILARDGELNPGTLGDPIVAHVDIYAVEGYIQDIWRVTPTLTATFGLNYSVQRPPAEREGRQMMLVYADTQQPLEFDHYLAARAEAAAQGLVFNPELAYMPIRSVSSMKYPVDIDWNNFGPRFALAWNPETDNWLFGNRKTVIRAGYSSTFTRFNGVGLVMTPVLGVGLAEALSCQGPTFNPVTQAFDTCAGASDPTDAFRVGVHGDSVPIPTPGPARIPFTVAAPFGETLSFGLDPEMKLGQSHSLDFTIQRELPADLIVEVGYVGRRGENLMQAFDVNSVPYFQLDPTSGTQLKDAFQFLADQVQGGASAAGIVSHPWFENLLDPAAFGVATCADVDVDAVTAGIQGGSCSAGLVDADSFSFLVGDLGELFIFNVDFLAFQPFDNLQVVFNNLLTDGGKSFYHAGFVSLHKRMSRGLTFDVNYTYGHSIDELGLNQENVYSGLTPFNRKLDRADSLWDIKHTFNANWFYELPFGPGREFSSDSAAANKILGGWYTAGILSIHSGLPLCVTTAAVGNFGAPLGVGCARTTASLSTGVNRGVTGTTAGTTGDVNFFADPDAAFAAFKPHNLARLERTGFGMLRGLDRWNLDFAVGKKTAVTERVSITFSVDFLNVFNHVELQDPGISFGAGLDLTDPDGFGVLSEQLGDPRFIQFGLRVEF